MGMSIGFSVGPVRFSKSFRASRRARYYGTSRPKTPREPRRPSDYVTGGAATDFLVGLALLGGGIALLALLTVNAGLALGIAALLAVGFVGSAAVAGVREGLQAGKPKPERRKSRGADDVLTTTFAADRKRYCPTCARPGCTQH